MKRLADLQTLFSRYELAVGGKLIAFGLVAGGLGVVLLNANILGFALLWLAAAVVSVVVASLSQCPTCEKSPDIYYFTNDPGEFGKFFFGGRLWPERECSNCGTRLDV